MMSIAYLLTGSNLGNRWQHICDALANIGKTTGEISAISPVYQSPAWGFSHPAPFLNQAIQLRTNFSPQDLLRLTLEIEKGMGRVRSHAGYEARNIDIDILLYDDLVIESPELTIPHPRMHLRRFALVPLLDINGSLIHPKLKMSMKKLLDACPDEGKVTLFVDHNSSIQDGGIDAV
ncbi:MAG TPA: 2-amino-4-hydroxy-6-hydroxymethyldihydropteridine diphosphokinase [Bacteroidales bacterium]|nr:2-amino-4-hydroxy-6-hydroxymethyldihydropteridine diphosphokinase [Bacteroidales bacterium]